MELSWDLHGLGWPMAVPSRGHSDYCLGWSYSVLIRPRHGLAMGSPGNMLVWQWTGLCNAWSGHGIYFSVGLAIHESVCEWPVLAIGWSGHGIV